MFSILLFFYYLFNLKKINISKKLLIISLFILSFNSFDNGIYLSNLYSKYPHIIMISAILFFIYWPVSYLYFKSNSEKENFKFKKLDLIYFIPFTYYLITWFPFFIKSGKEKIDFVNIPKDSSSNIVSRILAYLFMFMLLFLMTREYKKNKIKTFENKIFLIFNILLSLLSIGYYIYFLLIYKFHIKVSNIIGFVSYQLVFIIPLLLTVPLLLLLLKSLNSRDEAVTRPTIEAVTKENKTSLQPTINDLENLEDKNTESSINKLNDEKIVKNKDENINKEKYKMNKISESDAKVYLEKIIGFVEDNEAYKDNDFNLTVLSNELNIPSAYISQALNTYKKETFYTFLNKYRIEIAKKMLISSDYKNKTILAIAYESGFNSKATFNNFFKKMVGTTPSKYRQKNQVDL